MSAPKKRPAKPKGAGPKGAGPKGAGPPPGWSEHDIQSASVDVPSGPIAHW